MLVKTFPDYFGTYKIYEAVKEVLDKNLRKTDTNKVLAQLKHEEAQPENFMRKLSLVLKRHVHGKRVSSIMMKIKEQISELMDVEYEPEKIEFQKNGNAVLKVRVENKTEAMLKFKVGLEQLDHKNSAIIYNPVKNFTVSRLVKGKIIQAGKIHTYKFKLKPDIFEINDLYELKKKNELNLKLGFQVKAEGIDGFKSKTEKVPVTIYRVRR